MQAHLSPCIIACKQILHSHRIFRYLARRVEPKMELASANVWTPKWYGRLTSLTVHRIRVECL
jgi:hypothetical protein